MVLRIPHPDQDLSALLFRPKTNALVSGKTNIVFGDNSNSDNDYYVGPVAVTGTGVAHGLGVVATRDIVAGECLLVTRPAVSVDMQVVRTTWNQQESQQSQTATANTTQTQPQTLLEKICEQVLVQAMKEKLQSQDPQDCRDAQSFLLQLAHPTSNHDDNIRNNISLPETPTELLQALVGRSTKSTVEDSAYLEDDNTLLEIIRRNAFGPDFTTYESVEQQWTAQLQADLPFGDNISSMSPSRLLGLYPLAAMMNHSCVPNALRVFAGEYMMVHASSSIQQGEEIVWSYLPPIWPFSQRRAQLSERHGFICHCIRCEKEQEAANMNATLFVLPQSLQAFDKASSLGLTTNIHAEKSTSNQQFTTDLLDWERQLFSSTSSSQQQQFSNEVRRYWKMGNMTLYLQYLNAALMDVATLPPEQADKIRQNVLMTTMELHFCFVSCHYACTEHLSVMHLCYELVSILHSRSIDSTKTLPKVRFWTEQLKRAHLVRYGSLGNNVDHVRAVMKHTQIVLRNQNGLSKVNHDFI